MAAIREDGFQVRTPLSAFMRVVSSGLRYYYTRQNPGVAQLLISLKKTPSGL
jgi:hypothetical protein